MAYTRRQFGRLIGSAALMPAAFQAFAATERRRYKIRDVQTMTLTGPRTYVVVKVTADDGTYGIAEAYGTPGVGVKDQIADLKPLLVGKDPLEIDVIYTQLGEGTKNLSGTRTDGSAHNFMRAASGVEMALWDLAGKLLNQPVAVLLGGAFRDKVRVYDHEAPKDMLNKTSCREWAAKIKEDKSGFTAHKFGIQHSKPGEDSGRDLGNRVLSTKELMRAAQGFENCREAIGWDHDIMVHCHWEFDLRTSLQLAEAVAPMRPLWLEDPLEVDYSDSWKRLVAGSKVPICMGENLARREGFRPFIVNQAADILNPDLRNSGGFLETKRIADMADGYGLPMCTHNTASQLHTWANCQWAGAIRDFITCETITGQGGWMDQLLALDGPYIEKGFVRVNMTKPGLGADLNPDTVKAHLAPGENWWG
ncbi:MAG: Mandelate racemase/muconate lactonizing enzyme C-terminal domain protein [Bryobacterales bacterium]|jgi:L-alanine-DL-glutamate epimerase-like enolase superfamily enzyme|nr:Mandelate racemase/muconate lactonizing enzyme C-terminal domain protein [Bryobacterales bacterium]